MSADYGPAIWKASPNFNSGRSGQSIKAIVDHITAGAAGPSLEWLTNPASQVSSHYLVTRAGIVYQLVLDKDTAWGSGIGFSRGYAAYKSDLSVSWISDLWTYGPRFDSNLPNLANLEALQIEHEASVGQGLTELQYAATVGLHKHLVAKHNLPPDGEHIVGHSRLDAVTRANDPGATWDWARLFADLAAPVPAPPLWQQTEPTLHGLWALGNDLIDAGQKQVELGHAIQAHVVKIKQAEGYPS